MFMALRVNNEGLAKCGMDFIFSDVGRKQFPAFNGDLSTSEMTEYTQSVTNHPINAP
jgi:hypothetical protein